MSEEKVAADDKAQQQFDIQKIYLKDASLETPSSPGIFAEKWTPEIKLQINTTANTLRENVHEIVLTLTVTATLGAKTAFLAEIQQAGIFVLKGIKKDQIGPVLGAFCPNILFPYARETVDALVTRGGFPPLMLKPVNFDALYLQHVQARRNQQATAEAKH